MDDARRRDRLSFLGRRLPPGIELRAIVVAPGGERAYDEAEWLDALVVVERGEVELECLSGRRQRFRSGAVLVLFGLPLRALRNSSREPVLLVAVSRSRQRLGDEFRLGRGAPLRASKPTTTEVSAMADNFVWFDLRSKDPIVAEDFYGKLLGWQVQHEGDGPGMITGKDGPWAVIVPHRRGEPAWVPYVRVDDVDDATAQALDLGATVLEAVTDGPAGRLSTILDPGGAPLALWQPRG